MTSGQPDDDDGFGDFLGGPTSTTAPPTATVLTIVQPVATGHAGRPNVQPSPADSPLPEPLPEPHVGEPQPDPSVEVMEPRQAEEKKGQGCAGLLWVFWSVHVLTGFPRSLKVCKNL